MARPISRASLSGTDRDPVVPDDVPDLHTESGEVVLRLLHTADWHLGRRFPSFPEEGQKKLSRARMDVVGRILDVARRNHASAHGERYVAWTGGGDPTVEATFETGAQRIWRVRKQFGKA